MIQISETDLETIERGIGLHEKLEIVYVVDGYQLDLYTSDDAKVLFSVRAKTIARGLVELASLLMRKENE